MAGEAESAVTLDIKNGSPTHIERAGAVVTMGSGVGIRPGYRTTWILTQASCQVTAV